MNNSATTRAITKVALEYNGNDKGSAEMVASNYLLTDTAGGQFNEMKTVALRNREWNVFENKKEILLIIENLIELIHQYLYSKSQKNE